MSWLKSNWRKVVFVAGVGLNIACPYLGGAWGAPCKLISQALSVIANGSQP